MNHFKAWWPAALYLANLLILPGVAFIGLLILRLRASQFSNRERFYIISCFWLSVFSGVFLLVLPIMILQLGEWGSYAWMIAITGTVSLHGFLVILGVYVLARALSQKGYWFPFLACPNGV